MDNRQLLDKWREFYATTLFDLPAAAAQSLVLSADQHRRQERLGTAAWRAYDAWMWLVNETANRLYSTTAGRSPALGGHLRLVATDRKSANNSWRTLAEGFQSDSRLDAR
ncbi:MAG TPA: hypothetical protein VMU41_10445 [Candidatus Binataceae bacterium]|nr:hypothetical protein [Candidatus Binataceae bacterium]